MERWSVERTNCSVYRTRSQVYSSLKTGYWSIIHKIPSKLNTKEFITRLSRMLLNMC